MNNKWHFTSQLELSYRNSLEDILFFNNYQKKAREHILKCINLYGNIIIYEEKGLLRINTESFPKVQTLYAKDYERYREPLVGVMMYVRETVTTVRLLHIAVDVEYTESKGNLAVDFLLELRRIASITKGVNTIINMYSKKNIHLKINRRY